MTANEHLASLKARHADLEQRIQEEEHRPLPDQALITDLKRQKLRIKDEIAQMSRTAEPAR